MTTMRRLLAVLTALALAAFGAFVLITYVRDADARAEARAEEGSLLVPVVVVDEQITVGTPGAEIADRVSTQRVPARLKADDALGSVDDVAGLEGQALADLLPGEQVRRARFEVPQPEVVDDVVPPGLQEVSLALDPQRAVGGTLVEGDLVGVFVSGAGLNAATNTPTAVTALAVDRVLVTGVQQGGAADTGAQTVTVTLALGEADAAVVVAGQEQDSVWLSLQEPAGTADTSTGSSTTTTGADQ
jgi:pilus assembly protein CpaB